MESELYLTSISFSLDEIILLLPPAAPWDRMVLFQPLHLLSYSDNVQG